MSTSLDSLFTPGLIAAQQPHWPGGADGAQIKSAVAELKSFPPLVFAGECDDLKARIALAADGKAFWLQGGDIRSCNGRFDPKSHQDDITDGSGPAVSLKSSRHQSGTYGRAVCKASLK